MKIELESFRQNRAETIETITCKALGLLDVVVQCSFDRLRDTAFVGNGGLIIRLRDSNSLLFPVACNLFPN